MNRLFCTNFSLKNCIDDQLCGYLIIVSIKTQSIQIDIDKEKAGLLDWYSTRSITDR